MTTNVLMPFSFALFEECSSHYPQGGATAHSDSPFSLPVSCTTYLMLDSGSTTTHQQPHSHQPNAPWLRNSAAGSRTTTQMPPVQRLLESLQELLLVKRLE